MSSKISADKYLGLLIDAIKLFYINDADSLFGADKNVDERAMVGCIYRYMWCKIVREGINCDIDIEYDRMRGRNGGLVKKSIDLAQECGTENCRKECLKLIAKRAGKRKGKSDKELYSIRPDIILHMRNSEPGKDNYLVAEFKKAPVSSADDKFDHAKIRWNTCSRSLLRYDYGVVVKLFQKYAHLEQCDCDGKFVKVGYVDKDKLSRELL